MDFELINPLWDGSPESERLHSLEGAECIPSIYTGPRGAPCYIPSCSRMDHPELEQCCQLWFYSYPILAFYIDGLVQERRNSSALAMEWRLSCTNPSIFRMDPESEQCCQLEPSKYPILAYSQVKDFSFQVGLLLAQCSRLSVEYSGFPASNISDKLVATMVPYCSSHEILTHQVMNFFEEI